MASSVISSHACNIQLCVVGGAVGAGTHTSTIGFWLVFNLLHHHIEHSVERFGLLISQFGCLLFQEIVCNGAEFSIGLVKDLRKFCNLLQLVIGLC